MFTLEAKVEFTRMENEKEKFSFIFNAVNEIEITKSIDELGDTAVIKMPTQFKIKQNGEQSYTETAIQIGDKVTITLGYQDKYSGVEFRGYVKKISPKIPLEIHCEDAMFLLRRKNINKSWEELKLVDVLKEVVSDTPIKLSRDIQNINLQKWVVKDANGTQVLEKLKKDFGMYSFIDDENNLYCGLSESINIGKQVSYDLNYNLIANNLEFKSLEDRKIKIKYTYIDPDNKRTTIESGDADGHVKEFYTSVVSDTGELKKMAEAELKKLKYDGFDGSVTSFLIPFSTRGMSAKIIDEDHQNREGNYFIKKVVTTFGTNGARRIVSLGNKL